MPAILTAAQCPAIQTPASWLRRKDAYDNNGTVVPVARIIGPNSGLGNIITNPLNENALALDLIGRYGGGGYAVAFGLGLTPPLTGLTLNIAAGHAVVDGVVEVPSATTLAVPDNTARVWIWLQSNKTLTYTSTTTAPAGNNCLIGSCVTSAGSILSVDTSGVLYLRGGNLWRRTSDVGQPGDTPPAGMVFYTRTDGGLYLWDGTAYSLLDDTTTTLSDSIAELTARIEDQERTVRALIRMLVSLGIEDVLGDEHVAVAFNMAQSEAA